ncbi:MAG: transcriptional regulator [Planctomycetota bacterium]|jgi:predicted DNA-binding transcriptional regulator AlpA|nr:transcriptional regulator [Planctomycetota bacterium]
MNTETESPALPGPLLLDVKGVAALLGCEKALVWKLRSTGRIPPPVRLGRLTRWAATEITRWVAAGCPPAAKWAQMREG